MQKMTVFDLTPKTVACSWSYLLLILWGSLATMGCTNHSNGDQQSKSTARIREDDVLRPEPITVALVAWNAPFGGLITPNSSDYHGLQLLLDTPLPSVSDILKQESLVHILEHTLKRKLIWERVANTSSRGGPESLVEALEYREALKGIEHPTLRDGFAVILGYANTGGGVNFPANIRYLFNNYAMITDDYILVISLPVSSIEQ
jgi:hypothetical protein